MNAICRVVLGSILISMTMSSAGAVTDSFIRDIEHAKALASKGGVTNAIRFWEEKRPKYAKADGYYEYELGTLYSMASNFSRAEAAYRQAVDTNPASAKFCIGLSFLYLDTKRVADARTWAERAIKADPNDPMGYYTLGEIERRQGRLTVARDQLKKSLRVTPTAHASWLLAIVAYDLNDPDTVVQAMEMAVNLDRAYAGDKQGMLVAAVSLARLGKIENAYGALETLKANNQKITDADLVAVRKEIDKFSSKGRK
jgi:tetratricopeptide (TPR) repeat protein